MNQVDALISHGFARTRFGQQPSPVTLCNSDWDQTIARWTNFQAQRKDEVHFETTAQAVDEHVAHGGCFMVTSARSPSLMRVIAHLVDRFPMQKHAGNNGQYFVQKPDNAQRVGEFLQKLSLDTQADPDYARKVLEKCQTPQAAMQGHTWSVGLFQTVLHQVLAQTGFREYHPAAEFPGFADGSGDAVKYFNLAGDSLMTVTVITDQSGFHVGPITPGGQREAITPLHRQVARHLAHLVSRRLEAMGIRHELSFQQFATNCAVDVMPLGATKALATQHAVEVLENQGIPVKAVITLDDNHNGRQMLVARAYQAPSGRPVPNFPIVMGDKMRQDEALNTHPRLIRVLRNGGLGDAIRRQRERIEKL